MGAIDGIDGAWEESHMYRMSIYDLCRCYVIFAYGGLFIRRACFLRASCVPAHVSCWLERKSEAK